MKRVEIYLKPPKYYHDLDTKLQVWNKYYTAHLLPYVVPFQEIATNKAPNKRIKVKI